MKLKGGRIELKNGSVNEEIGLKNSIEFRRYVKKNLWKDRRRNGFDWHQDVFDFLREVYKDRGWLELGVVQADFRELDQPLWSAIQHRLRGNEKMPPDIELPALKDAKLDAIDDPVERQKVIELRESFKKVKNHYRARRSVGAEPSP